MRRKKEKEKKVSSPSSPLSGHSRATRLHLSTDIGGTAEELGNSLGDNVVDGICGVEAVEPEVLVDRVCAGLVEGVPFRRAASNDG